MRRGSATTRAIRTLGTLVLAVFLLGLTSGPLRKCVSHPAHATGAHAGELAPEHVTAHHGPAHEERAPDPGHGGCTCLGQCSLEQAPHVGVGVPALAHGPEAPRALAAASGALPSPIDRIGIPLARPPPAVV
jgi:hypothetical protein